jgi:hypothetical protein
MPYIVPIHIFPCSSVAVERTLLLHNWVDVEAVVNVFHFCPCIINEQKTVNKTINRDFFIVAGLIR